MGSGQGESSSLQGEAPVLSQQRHLPARRTLPAVPGAGQDPVLGGWSRQRPQAGLTSPLSPSVPWPGPKPGCPSTAATALPGAGSLWGHSAPPLAGATRGAPWSWLPEAPPSPRPRRPPSAESAGGTEQRGASRDFQRALQEGREGADGGREGGYLLLDQAEGVLRGGALGLPGLADGPGPHLPQGLLGLVGQLLGQHCQALPVLAGHPGQGGEGGLINPAIFITVLTQEGRRGEPGREAGMGGCLAKGGFFRGVSQGK